MSLPCHEQSPWRDGTVTLAGGCQPQASGVSAIAVEQRRCRLALAGGNGGGISLLDVRDLSKPASSSVPAAPSRTPPGGTALVKPRCVEKQWLEGGHDGRVQAVAWLPDDDLLFVSGGDECVKIWDASSLDKCAMGVNLHTQVRAVSVTNAPKAVAAAALGDSTIRMIDLRMGRAVNTLQGHSSAVMCLSWGEIGSQRLFSGSMDGTVRAWDVRMGARSLFLCDPYALEENRPPLKRNAPTEEELQRKRNPFAKKQEGPLTLAGAKRYEPYRPMMSANSFLGTDRPTYAPTGQTYGTGMPQVVSRASAPSSPPRQSVQEKLREELWDADAVKRARQMFAPPRREYEHEASVAHKGAVISVTFVPAFSVEEDNRLLSCGVDGKLRIWNAATGAPASASSAAGLEVESWSKAIPLQLAVAGTPDDVCFLPEGDRISVRCLKTGELLCGLAAHKSEVHCATILPSRGELYTGGNDGHLLKWKVESRALSNDVICLD